MDRIHDRSAGPPGPNFIWKGGSPQHGIPGHWHEYGAGFWSTIFYKSDDPEHKRRVDQGYARAIFEAQRDSKIGKFQDVLAEKIRKSPHKFSTEEYAWAGKYLIEINRIQHEKNRRNSYIQQRRLAIREEQQKGRETAIAEQQDFNFSPLSDPPLSKMEFRKSYLEQWRRFHEFMVESIAARLESAIDDESRLELQKIFTDQYKRWRKLDPEKAINWRKIKSRNELLITDNQPLDLPDGHTIAAILNKHIFDPLRQAGIDPSTTVPIEAQAQLRLFNATGHTRQPSLLRNIGR